jgi:hypothetical protein
MKNGADLFPFPLREAHQITRANFKGLRERAAQKTEKKHARRMNCPFRARLRKSAKNQTVG